VYPILSGNYISLKMNYLFTATLFALSFFCAAPCAECINICAQDTAIQSDTPEVMRFDAVRKDDRIKLSWTTYGEEDNLGFEVERRMEGKKDFERIGFVEGFGTTSLPTNYTFSETNASTETYYYRLQQINISGEGTYSAERGVKGYNTENPNTILTTNKEKKELTIQFGKLLPMQTSAKVRIINPKNETAQEINIAAASHQIFTVDITDLPLGAYVLLVDFNDEARLTLSFLAEE
jgi:hypothetical protein